MSSRPKEQKVLLQLGPLSSSSSAVSILCLLLSLALALTLLCPLFCLRFTPKNKLHSYQYQNDIHWGVWGGFGVLTFSGSKLLFVPL